MAQRKRQTTANRAEPAREKAPIDRLQRPAIEPHPPKKRLWFLLLTAAALVVWAGFLVAMALL